MNEQSEIYVYINEKTRFKPKNFFSKIDKTSHPNGCWIWTAGKDINGYGTFGVRTNNLCDTMRPHRLMFWIAYGYFPEAVCHRCDNPPCLNPEHLFGGTLNDNTQDMIRKGRAKHGSNPPKGQRAGTAKLTDELALKIYNEYKAGGTSYPKLGKKYGVSFSAVHKIINGSTFSHVTGEKKKIITYNYVRKGA
jgi:hypothetical protein